jgi:hypothetical protein
VNRFFDIKELEVSQQQYHNSSTFDECIAVVEVIAGKRIRLYGSTEHLRRRELVRYGTKTNFMPGSYPPASSP